MTSLLFLWDPVKRTSSIQQLLLAIKPYLYEACSSLLAPAGALSPSSARPSSAWPSGLWPCPSRLAASPCSLHTSTVQLPDLSSTVAVRLGFSRSLDRLEDAAGSNNGHECIDQCL